MMQGRQDTVAPPNAVRVIDANVTKRNAACYVLSSGSKFGLLDNVNTISNKGISLTGVRAGLRNDFN